MNQLSSASSLDCTCTELFNNKLLCKFAEGLAIEGRCRKIQMQLNMDSNPSQQSPIRSTGALVGAGTDPLPNLNGVMSADGRDVTAISMPPASDGTRVLDYTIPPKGTVLPPVVSPDSNNHN